MEHLLPVAPRSVAPDHFQRDRSGKRGQHEHAVGDAQAPSSRSLSFISLGASPWTEAISTGLEEATSVATRGSCGENDSREIIAHSYHGASALRLITAVALNVTSI